MEQKYIRHLNDKPVVLILGGAPIVTWRQHKIGSAILILAIFWTHLLKEEFCGLYVSDCRDS